MVVRLPKHAEIWLSGYIQNRLKALAPAPKPKRLWVTLADHYEPLGGRVDMDTARARVARWQEAWPRIA